MSSNSVYNHPRDKQIGPPLRGRPILLITLWLQTELDSTRSYYHYVYNRFYEIIPDYKKQIKRAAEFWRTDLFSNLMILIWKRFRLFLAFQIFYIHFEITGDLCSLIGSHQSDLFSNPTIFCSKLHHFPSQWESFNKTQ